MKAFSQINLNFENRMVFSYAGILLFLCSFIVLNPLFGQENDEPKSKPEVRIDVNKEYDENGNVVGYDSTYKWFWSGNEITAMNFDSIFENFHDDFGRNHFESFGYFHYPGNLDSNIFDKEFLNQLNFKNEYFPFHDSTIASYFDFDEFNHHYSERHSNYLERLRKYQEEHQKLIEKYFGKPLNEYEPNVKYEQQQNIPRKNNSKNEVRI